MMTDIEEVEDQKKSFKNPYIEFSETVHFRKMPVYYRVNDVALLKDFSKSRRIDLNSQISRGVDENLKFSIRNYDFYLNGALKQIHDSIEESQTMFDDHLVEECGKEPDFESYINAIHFLCAYANCLFLKNDMAILKSPYIDAMPNGDVYLDWKTDKADFLIIFKKDKDISYFFGQSKIDNLPFKSAVNNKGPVKEFLLHWFKENICY
jgi:hypothetical protein